MHGLLKRGLLWVALLGGLLGGVPAQADVDPVARALAVQAKSQAADPQPGVANKVPSSAKNFRAALANTYLGQSDTKILFIYDSTGVGRGAGTTNSGYDGARPYSLPTQFAKSLARMGTPTTWGSFLGSSGLDTGFPNYDVRVVFGSGWAPVGLATQQSFGGEPFTNSTTTSALSFIPIPPITGCDVYYIKQSGYATFTVSMNGVVKATVDSNGATSLAKVAVTADARAVQALTINRTGAGTSARIVGADCYDTTTPQVRVLVSAKGGTTIGYWVSGNSGAAYNVVNSLAVLQPNLVIIGLGINDWNAPTPLANFIADYTTLIAAAKTANSDCMLVGPNQSATPGYGYATADVQASYTAALKVLAAQQGCLFADQTYRLGDYTEASRAVYGYYYDPLHLARLGQMDIGNWLAAIVVAP